VRVLYVSPLKALVYDIERNLRAPLAGIAERAGDAGSAPRVSVRTGDTPARERRLQARDPGEILVTTPESLYLILGSAARETLRSVEWVIIDEVHALAPTKRGAHLALSLERLAQECGRDPQRIGLSATAAPLPEVARFLGGRRPVSIVDASERPHLDLRIEVPLDDLSSPGSATDESAAADAPAADAAPVDSGPTDAVASARAARSNGRDAIEARTSVWPAIYPALLDAIRKHRSTIVFANSRWLCDRLSQRTNELAVLKALGFTDRGVLGLVLGECTLLTAIGGGLGLLLGWLLVGMGDPTNGSLPVFFVPNRVLVTGIVLIAVMAFLAGILPALQAQRLQIADALRR